MNATLKVKCIVCKKVDEIYLLQECGEILNTSNSTEFKNIISLLEQDHYCLDHDPNKPEVDKILGAKDAKEEVQAKEGKEEKTRTKAKQKGNG